MRQSTYDPYKAGTDTTPELKQVLISIAGADNDRYSVFYQDQRGDWRVFGDQWKGLLTDVKTLYIDDLCVDEAERRKGVAKRLFAYVRRFAADNGFDWITLNVWSDNVNAAAFYRAMGMQPRRIILEQRLG